MGKQLSHVATLGHFFLQLLVFVNDSLVLEDDLPGLLPIGQVSCKRFLPNNKNTIGTIGQGYFRTLTELSPPQSFPLGIKRNDEK